MATLCNLEGLKSLKVYLPGLLLALFWAHEQNIIGALAVIGFWIAWELNWWGGADAVTAITLCLIWPTVGLSSGSSYYKYVGSRLSIDFLSY